MGIARARILKCVTLPSSRESSQPRDRNQVSRVALEFFTIWDTRETLEYRSGYPFSRGTSNPGMPPNQGLLHCRWFFMCWATGKPIKTGGLIKQVKIPRKRRTQDFHCLMGREKTRLNGYGCICVNSRISIDTVNLLNIELNIGVKYCVFTLQLYLLPFLPSGNEHPFHPGF